MFFFPILSYINGPILQRCVMTRSHIHRSHRRIHYEQILTVDPGKSFPQSDTDQILMYNGMTTGLRLAMERDVSPQPTIYSSSFYLVVCHQVSRPCPVILCLINIKFQLINYKQQLFANHYVYLNIKTQNELGHISMEYLYRNLMSGCRRYRLITVDSISRLVPIIVGFVGTGEPRI